MVTPFTSDGTVDERSLRSFVDWQITSGVHFLVPCGSTGEAATMTTDEHRRVVEITVEQTAGRVPVVAGAASNDTAKAIALSRMMEKMRANPDKVEAGIASTIGQEDTRRPRFELGLGVWNLTGSIFFPLALLYAGDRVLITQFDNRPLLIYQEQDAVAPVAAYLETHRASWEGDMLRLDKGAYIQNDTLFAG